MTDCLSPPKLLRTSYFVLRGVRRSDRHQITGACRSRDWSGRRSAAGAEQGVEESVRVDVAGLAAGGRKLAKHDSDERSNMAKYVQWPSNTSICRPETREE